MRKGFGVGLFVLTNTVFSSVPWHSGNLASNLMWTIAGGPAWTASGETMLLTDKLGSPQTYYTSGDQQSHLGVGELFLGFYKELNNAVQGQLGVEVAYGGNVKLSGHILVDNNTNTSNADYSYQVYQVRAAIKGKLVLVDLPVSSLIQPYASLGLGVGFNNSMNYTLSPSNKSQVYPLFSNKTVNAFTYTAGGGFQIPVNPFMQLGIGYEYASWGKSQLGNASGLMNLPVPSLDTINVNTLLVSLSYTS